MKRQPIEDQLLKEILDNPSSDILRFAYADWLQEHGEDWQKNYGEFIHYQLIGKDPPYHIHYWIDKMKWVGAMGHQWIWKVEVNPGSYSWGISPDGTRVEVKLRGVTFTITRGFTSHIGCPETLFFQYVARETPKHPIQGIQLTDKTPDNVRKRSGDKRCYTWFKHSTCYHNTADQHRIDDRLFPDNRRRYNFPTELEATNWLSNQCMEYCKKLEEAGEGGVDYSQNYIDM